MVHAFWAYCPYATLIQTQNKPRKPDNTHEHGNPLTSRKKNFLKRPPGLRRRAPLPTSTALSFGVVVLLAEDSGGVQGYTGYGLRFKDPRVKIQGLGVGSLGFRSWDFR